MILVAWIVTRCQDMENKPPLRCAPRAKQVEFRDEVLAGIGDMNMYEEEAGSDTEQVNRSRRNCDITNES